MTLREGQKAFNELYQTDPEIAKLLTGTEFDPFYDDSRLSKFNEKVRELRNLK
ncbi:MAG: hypothetical protein ACKOW9_05325 [Candidatus Paceibacterota bacterium]